MQIPGCNFSIFDSTYLCIRLKTRLNFPTQKLDQHAHTAKKSFLAASIFLCHWFKLMENMDRGLLQSIRGLPVNCAVAGIRVNKDRSLSANLQLKEKQYEVLKSVVIDNKDVLAVLPNGNGRTNLKVINSFIMPYFLYYSGVWNFF